MAHARFDASRVERKIEAAALELAERSLDEGLGDAPSRGRRRGLHAVSLRLRAVSFARGRGLRPEECLACARAAGRLLAKASRRKLFAEGDYQPVWPWLRSLAELSEDLPGRDLEAWRERLGAECAYLERQVRSRLRRGGNTAFEIGTGPNHYVRWVAMLLLGGKVLGEPAWVKLGGAEAGRYADAMHPDGYWPEHHGPASRYNTVSIRGMAMCRRASGSRDCDRAIRRSVEFFLKTSYPGGSAVETLDERNRYGRAWGRADLADAFSLSPVGRRFLATTLLGRARAGRDHHGWPALASAVDCLGMIRSGATASLPWERREFRYALSDLPASVRHSGPWTVALSAIPSAPWFHNPYMLERQQLISVFHRKAGLVIGGGNDKFNPGAATLCLLDGAEVWYNVPVAGSVRRRGRSEELTADFGPASGSIRATPRGPGRLDLELGMEPRTADDTSFVNLQIPVRKGMRLRFAGKPLRLTKRPVERRAGPRGAVLAFGRSRIRVPAGTAFRFPHRPYNSYGGDPHEYGPEGWVGLLSAELGPGGGSIEVTVEVD